jgi:hypothetical protein
VTSDGVLDAVAEQTGAPRERLDAIVSSRSGSSNVIEVRYVGRSQDEARAVVEAASREALLLQANSDLAFAAAGVDVAQAAFDAAVDDFEARAEETNFYYPDSQLQQLGDDLLAAERRDDEAEIERISALLPVAQEVQRLKNLADASLVNLTSALDRQRQAEGNVEAANTIPIAVGDVVRLSKLQAMIKQGAYAALFGAALAVGFVIIVELLRSGTGTTRPSLPRPTRQRSSAGAF